MPFLVVSPPGRWCLIFSETKRCSTYAANTTFQRKWSYTGLLLLNVQDSHPYVAIGKISAETRRFFVALVMPLSVQILFRPTIADLAIAIRLRSSVEQPLLVVISDPRKLNCVTCSTSVPSTTIGSSFPSLPTIMILVLLTFSRRPRASLLAFTISSSSSNSNALVATSALVVSSAYRRLLSL